MNLNRVIVFLFFLLVATTCFCWYTVRLLYGLSPQVPNDLYTITKLSFCDGFNESGDSIDVSNVFFTNTKAILVCGCIYGKQPITFTINWYYEDELIFQDIIRGGHGHFISRFIPQDGFQKGNYEIYMRIGRSPVWRTEFLIEEE